MHPIPSVTFIFRQYTTFHHLQTQYKSYQRGFLESTADRKLRLKHPAVCTPYCGFIRQGFVHKGPDLNSIWQPSWPFDLRHNTTLQSICSFVPGIWLLLFLLVFQRICWLKSSNNKQFRSLPFLLYVSATAWMQAFFLLCYRDYFSFDFCEILQDTSFDNVHHVSFILASRFCALCYSVSLTKTLNGQKSLPKKLSKYVLIIKMKLDSASDFLPLCFQCIVILRFQRQWRKKQGPNLDKYTLPLHGTFRCSANTYVSFTILEIIFFSVFVTSFGHLSKSHTKVLSFCFLKRLEANTPTSQQRGWIKGKLMGKSITCCLWSDTWR